MYICPYYRWDARNANVKDCDEWFGKERDWAAKYGAQIRYLN